MTKNKIGLIVGGFLAIVHAIWSLAVAVMPGALQSFIDWILVLHHIDLSMFIITPFVFMNAVWLVVITFIFGYLFGWIIGWLSKIVKC